MSLNLRCHVIKSTEFFLLLQSTPQSFEVVYEANRIGRSMGLLSKDNHTQPAGGAFCDAVRSERYQEVGPTSFLNHKAGDSR